MNEIDLIFKDLYQKMPKAFDLNVSNSVSSILLFKDYISKLNDWKKLLDKDYRPLGKSINIEYNNIIKDINPALQDDMLSFEMFYNRYKQMFELREDLLGGRIINYFFIYWFVYWEFFKKREEMMVYENYSNPYEGLVKLFKNDNIYIGEGINISGVIMRDSSMNLKLPSIEDDFLAYIDSKCKLIGSAGIPNQEKVNELWEEFQSLNKTE